MNRSEEQYVERRAVQEAPPLVREPKVKITPGERWFLISERAYSRAQRRGFVGGDPFKDWAAAEREVDSQYQTESSSEFGNLDVAELTETVRRFYGGFGMGHLSLDTILEKYRLGLESIATRNRALIDNTSKLANDQTELFQDAVNDAMEALYSFSQGKVDINGDHLSRQAQRSTQAIENVLSYLKSMTDTTLDNAGSQKGRSQGR